MIARTTLVPAAAIVAVAVCLSAVAGWGASTFALASQSAQPSAVSGAAGTDGADGKTGETGADGTAGITGAMGATGATGRDGAQLSAGAVGPAGAMGAAGIQGVTGIAGTAGLQGAIGITGAQGAQGSAGLPGLPGLPGMPGMQGLQGDAGLAGATGATGSRGVVGAAGMAGAAGVDGASGVQGAMGLTGPAGRDGDTGLKGDTGIKGDTGEKGDTGDAGADGADGADGATGARGATGPAGPAGPAGTSTTSTANGKPSQCTDPLSTTDDQIVAVTLTQGATKVQVQATDLCLINDYTDGVSSWSQLYLTIDPLMATTDLMTRLLRGVPFTTVSAVVSMKSPCAGDCPAPDTSTYTFGTSKLQSFSTDSAKAPSMLSLSWTGLTITRTITDVRNGASATHTDYDSPSAASTTDGSPLDCTAPFGWETANQYQSVATIDGLAGDSTLTAGAFDLLYDSQCMQFGLAGTRAAVQPVRLPIANITPGRAGVARILDGKKHTVVITTTVLTGDGRPTTVSTTTMTGRFSRTLVGINGGLGAMLDFTPTQIAQTFNDTAPNPGPSRSYTWDFTTNAP